jgi:hypothetical protein
MLPSNRGSTGQARCGVDGTEDVTEVDDPEDARVLVAEDPNGALVVGAEGAVADFVAKWTSSGGLEVVGHVHLKGAELGAALSSAAELGATAVKAARYLRIRNTPASATGEVRLVERGSDGRFASSSPIDPGTLLAVGPFTALALVAAQAALMEATQELRAAIQLVDEKADELLRLMSAQRAGDVNGHYQLLRRMVGELDAGVELTDTDWSTVASLGPPLEVGIARLRDYAARLVGELPIGLPADERAERLERVVMQRRLGEALRLLVVAEQSLYLWQRLRLAQFTRAEPQHVRRAVDGAHKALAEHLEADAALAHDLRAALEDYSRLRPFEFHRKFSGRRFDDALTRLESVVAGAS